MARILNCALCAVALMASLIAAHGCARHHPANPGPLTSEGPPPGPHSEPEDPEKGTAYIVNPDAAVRIVVVPNQETMDHDVARDQFPYHIAGLYRHIPGFIPVIFLQGPRADFNEMTGTLLHEYEHYLEDKFPDKAPELRHAFLDLMDRKNGFDISQVDLADEIVPNK